MSESERAEVAKGLLTAIFVESIESGRIVVQDRPAAEVVADFERDCKEFVHSPEFEEYDFPIATTHDATLKQVAMDQAASGNAEVAIVLYAVAIEHSVNLLVLTALERNGSTSENILRLLRETRLETKVTSLWALAGLPSIGDEYRRYMEQVSSERNAFVHYKWPSVRENQRQQSRTRLEQALTKAVIILDRLDELADEAFWCGRKQELLAFFEEGFDDHLSKYGSPPVT